jgi:hypothetical protein
MSSHREAREISKDPVADSTDLYAFMSPDRPGFVTLIANYIPLQEPAGGPNFYEFGDDVHYEIHIDNDGDAQPDITYRFTFETKLTSPQSFLYNTGPIGSLSDPNWNSKQFYTVTRIDRHGSQVLGRHLACPPCNIGPLSTPDYAANLGMPAVHTLSDGASKVFAGQRAEAFYVDLGSIFDLADLRPLQAYQVFAKAKKPPLGNQPGVNATNELNVHSIALQVPVGDLVKRRHHTIGVWTTASRRRVRLFGDSGGDHLFSGPWQQVSRLGNPLINEVLIPLGQKDYWNSQPPAHDKQFLAHYANPELANLLPVLYPGQFPHLATLNGPPPKNRADLEAVLLTGVPAGLIPGFTNFTGPVQADMLRLNTSIPPTPFASLKPLGVAAGDLAGYPNGRRVQDDVVTIELEAIAGLLYPLVDPAFMPDPVVKNLQVSDGLTGSSINPAGQPLDTFPYLGVPYDGYHFPA